MNIPQLVQQSLQAWIKSNAVAGLIGDIPAANVYRGIQHDPDETVKTTMKLPKVICNCQGAEFVNQFSGNRVAQAAVEVFSNADDTYHDKHQTRVATVWDLFATATIAADLSAATASFTAFLVVPKSEGWDVSGRCWRSFLNLEIHCAPSDIT